MKKIAFMLALVFAAISAVGSESAVTWAQAQREYQRIVIASDLHYPVRGKMILQSFGKQIFLLYGKDFFL